MVFGYLLVQSIGGPDSRNETHQQASRPCDTLHRGWPRCEHSSSKQQHDAVKRRHLRKNMVSVFARSGDVLRASHCQQTLSSPRPSLLAAVQLSMKSMFRCSAPDRLLPPSGLEGWGLGSPPGHVAQAAAAECPNAPLTLHVIA